MLWLLEISCILFQGSRWEPLVWKLFGTTWCLSATCFINWWSGTRPFVQFPFPSRYECFVYKDPRNNPEKSPLVWGKLGNRSSLFFHFILVCFIRSKQEWLPQLLFLPARKVFVGSPALLLGGFLEPRGFFFFFNLKPSKTPLSLLGETVFHPRTINPVLLAYTTAMGLTWYFA